MFTMHVTKIRWYLSLLWSNDVKEPKYQETISHVQKQSFESAHTDVFLCKLDMCVFF